MIRRNPRPTRYLKASKVPFEDIRLTWKARGILGYLLTKPDAWEVMVEHLITQAPDQRASLEAGLAELERFGYLRRGMVPRAVRGRFIPRYDVVVEEGDHCGFSAVENPHLVTTEPVTSDKGSPVSKINSGGHSVDNRPALSGPERSARIAAIRESLHGVSSRPRHRASS